MKPLYRGVLFGLAAVSSALWASAGPPAGLAPAPAAAPAPRPKTIKILSDVPLPPSCRFAADVRWAGDRKIYLGLGPAGTVAANVEPAGSEPQELIPGQNKPGGLWLSHHVAASEQYVVAAGPALSLSWRHLGTAEREQFAFEAIQGIDVRDNRLAIVGTKRDEQGRYAPDGAIAWIGSLDKRLADLQPILYDTAGPGAARMNNCSLSLAGGVRFLADGSLVVVTGVQPDIQLYDGQGKLLKTWDTERLGIDTDCASLSNEQAARLIGSSRDRLAWINQRRTVESVLPLGNDIGVVVRSVQKEHTHWDLKLLRRDGSVATYSLPIEGSTDSFFLQGDARAGKLAFVLRKAVVTGAATIHPLPPHLILAEAPKG